MARILFIIFIFLYVLIIWPRIIHISIERMIEVNKA